MCLRYSVTAMHAPPAATPLNLQFKEGSARAEHYEAPTGSRVLAGDVNPHVDVEADLRTWKSPPVRWRFGHHVSEKRAPAFGCSVCVRLGVICTGRNAGQDHDFRFSVATAEIASPSGLTAASLTTGAGRDLDRYTLTDASIQVRDGIRNGISDGISNALDAVGVRQET